MPINIPNQLQDASIRFVRNRVKDKIPIDQDWPTTGNYGHDDTSFLAHLQTDGNYGVITGHGLVVIDCDDEELSGVINEKLPPTFTVKTGGGGTHYYYKSEQENKIILTKNNKHYGEVQAKGQQVIGPTCVHPSGGIYSVLNDIEIAFIDNAELKAVLSPYTDGLEKPPMSNGINYETNPILADVKNAVKISDVLQYYGISTTKNPTNCPSHSSMRGKCLSFKDDVWFCFHCNRGGNIFHMIMEKEGLEFKESVKKAAEIKGIDFEKLQVVFQEEKLKEGILMFTEDYLKTAKEFIKIQPLYYDKSHVWWLWNHELTRWEMVDETDLYNKIDHVISKNTPKNTVSSQTKSQIIESLRRVGRQNKPEKPKDSWVQFKDVIIDVRTGERFKAEPRFLVTNPIPWEMGESDETPIIDRLFLEWVVPQDRWENPTEEDRGNVKLLYEIVAYCALPSYPIHRVFCFNGSGSNGKTKYMKIIEQFVGLYNTCTTDFDLLISSRFETGKLFKKLACFMGEINVEQMKKTSTFKRLCGEDTLGFEMKHKMPFDEYNFATLLIATNSLPITPDRTEGFYRRWTIIDFWNKFNEKKDALKDIPEYEFNNLALKTSRILRDLLEKREFTNQGTIEERRDKFEQASNPIMQFIKVYCEQDVNEYVVNNEFGERYKDYLKKTGRRVKNPVEIGMELKREGFERTRRKINNISIKVIWGLKWKNMEKEQKIL